MFLQFCQQAGERVKFMKCFVWQSFCLEPESYCDSNFSAQHQVNTIVKEQFGKLYELTELGLSALHLKD